MRGASATAIGWSSPGVGSGVAARRWSSAGGVNLWSIERREIEWQNFYATSSQAESRTSNSKMHCLAILRIVRSRRYSGMDRGSSTTIVSSTHSSARTPSGGRADAKWPDGFCS